MAHRTSVTSSPPVTDIQPYFQNELVTLYQGDSRKILSAVTDISVTATVCDPPYELAVELRTKLSK
jgi:hypothetical protein